jgi:hypothetical protein
MKRSFTFCVLLFCLNYETNAQTSLTIIGTVHNKITHINADTILRVLYSLKPDLILMELDTSLMDEVGNYKKIDPKNINSNENEAAERYKEANHVLLRRFDVVYRNKYYKDHNTFAKEAQMGKMIDSLFQHNALNDTSWFIVSSLYQANQILSNIDHMQLLDVNSEYYINMTEFRQNWLYRKELGMIKNNPELKSWYPFFKDDADFWEMRNATIVKNIAAYTKEFNGKRIVVLIGGYHKYALLDGLRPLQKADHFILNEYTSQ